MIGPKDLSAALANARRSLHRKTYGLDGASLSLRLSEPGWFDWLEGYFHPFFGPEPAQPTRHFTLSVSFDDRFVTRAFAGLGDVTPFRAGRRAIFRQQLTETLILDAVPEAGAAFVTDPAQDTVTLFLSAQSLHPPLEIARSFRQIAADYLKSRGWSYLHAGAIHTSAGLSLVIGDAGMGKTSLVAALCAYGAGFCANERVFARPTVGGGVEILSFPMPIATGLGTAQQHPNLEQAIMHPGTTSYPPRRMNLRRIYDTDPKDWPGLPDKIQFLPREFAQRLGAPPAPAGGPLVAVLIPKLTPEALTPTLGPVPDDTAAALFHRNIISHDTDPIYPSWLPLNDTAPTDVPKSEMVQALLRLPRSQLSFHTAQNPAWKTLLA